MIETIKPIEEINGYHISNTGVVYSQKYSKRYNKNCEMRVVKPRTHPSGYLYVGLYEGEGKHKVRYWRRVHRLVAQHHIGEIPEGMEVDHIDGNRHNNNVENLRIVTHRENVIAGFKRRNNGN